MGPSARPVRILWVLLFLSALSAPILVCADDVRAASDYWISKAEERLRAGDRAEALSFFQRASWERPQDPVLHYNMGVLSESLGRYSEAVNHYMAYLRWDPQAADRDRVKGKAFRLCGRLGAEAYEGGEYTRALDWYNKARDLYPKAKAVHFNLSRVYEALGNWDRAVSSLKDYWSLCDDREKGPVKDWIADFLRKKGEESYRTGYFEEALARYKEAARWDPNDTGLILKQGYCEERLGRLERAKDLYLAYLEAEPLAEDRQAVLDRVLQIHLALAQQHLERGEVGRAQQVLDRGLEIFPNNRDLHELFATLYLEREQPVQAVAHLERTLELVPDEEDRRPYVRKLVLLATRLADQAYRRNDAASARRYLKKAALWDPNNATVAFNLGRVYEREGDQEQAILAYRRYLFLDPDAGDRAEVKAKIAYYYSSVGSERFHRGELAQAQEAFEQALLIRPEDPVLLYNLAMVLLKRGKTGQSLSFLERYLRYEKDPQEVQRVQRQVRVLVQRMEVEERLVRRSSVPEPQSQEGAGQDEAARTSLDDRKKAFRLLQAGRWKEALDLYERHTRRYPADKLDERLQSEIAEACREISRVALLNGNSAEALQALEKARQWSPSETFPYLWKGSVYESMGRSEDALRVYEESLRYVRSPEGRKAIQNRIVGILTQDLQDALRRQDLRESLRVLTRMEPYLDRGRRREIHYQKARIERALGNRSAALLNYSVHMLESPGAMEDPRLRQEVLSLVGDDPGLAAAMADGREAYTQGREAARRGDHPRALFCLLMARNAEGVGPEVDEALLGSLRALDLNQQALERLQQRKGPPVRVPAYDKARLLATSRSALRDYYRRGLYEEGLEWIRKMEQSDLDKEGDVLVMEGIFEEMAGRYSEAIQRYDRALLSRASLSREQDDLVNRRLCILLIREALEAYGQRDYARCLDSLKRAEALQPGRRDVAFNLGCVYLRLRDPNGALQAFSRYLALSGDDTARRELTQKAVVLLKRQIAHSPAVRYEEDGVAMDLVFERTQSVGQLLTTGQGVQVGRDERDLLDKVLLAPYLERPVGEEEEGTVDDALALSMQR